SVPIWPDCCASTAAASQHDAADTATIVFRRMITTPPYSRYFKEGRCISNASGTWELSVGWRRSTVAAYNRGRASRLYRPVRRWHVLHRLHNRPQQASRRSQRRPWSEVHGGPTAGVACLLGSSRIAVRSAETRASTQAIDACEEGGAHRTLRARGFRREPEAAG